LKKQFYGPSGNFGRGGATSENGLRALEKCATLWTTKRREVKSRVNFMGEIGKEVKWVD